MSPVGTRGLTWSLGKRRQLKREQFKEVVAEAVDAVTIFAEQRVRRSLPRTYTLGWLGGPVMDPGNDIVELITSKVFISENEIYPCIDLFLDDLLPDGRLLVICYRAGYPPGPFGEHWQYRTGGGHNAGRVGPFKLGCTKLIEKLSASQPP